MMPMLLWSPALVCYCLWADLSPVDQNLPQRSRVLSTSLFACGAEIDYPTGMLLNFSSVTLQTQHSAGMDVQHGSRRPWQQKWP